ncbi:MAG: PD-(D/E)XK nuclease family protein [Oscillospiraceae bacterium]|nr:PD-(D/E)XK nuclease family protein [Oscillospiraceae bacterium]
MLHFILGRVKSGKTSYITNMIDEKKSSGSLLVVPEQFSHTTERLLCEKLGNTVSLHTEVTNFRRLATKVKSEVGGLAAEILGNGARILHLHSAISDVAPALTVLGKSAASPEKLSSLLSVIDEFKAYGVSPETLSSVIQDMSASLRRKLSDISLIYAAYESCLGEDTFDAYDELTFVAKALRTSDFFSGRYVYFDNFTGFSAAQFDIIEAAIKRAKDVYIALELPKNMANGIENGIFDETFSTKKKLSSLAERNSVEVSEIYLESDGTDALSHLDRALFADEPLPYEKASPEICISSSDGIFEECEKSAGYILKKISEGKRFRDFSVVVPDGEYLRIATAVFDRYGIPSYKSRSASLTESPIVSLILNALECAVRGLRTDTLTEYVKTGFSDISSKSLDIFENYLYTWSPKNYEWNSERDFTKNPLGISAPESDESRELLRVVNRVKKKLTAPIKKLSEACAKNSGGEDVARALFDFINDIALPRRVSAMSYLSELSGRVDDAREYDAILEIIYEIINDIGHLKSDVLAPEDILPLFRLVVSQYELSTIPATIDCVNIALSDRACGERCLYRIVLGANDGVFPASEHDSGLLTDNDRQELSNLGITLAPSLCERIYKDIACVHGILCSSERGLYISYLTTSPKGEEMFEAEAVSRIRSIFPEHSAGLSLHEARTLSRIPCFDECVSEGIDIRFDDDDILAEKLSSIQNNSKNTRGPIHSKENIEAVFGKKIRLSASKADLFCSCRYAYFLKYGLGAHPKKRAEISPIEAGNLMHYVLEKVICRLAEEDTYDIEKATEYSREYVREYLKETLTSTDELSGRMNFLLARIENTVIGAVCDICRELECGSFVPTDFELEFSHDGTLAPIEISGENSEVSFVGKVDRIDTYSHDGKLFFRVIDYKSGTKHFSLNETVNGIGMQLLLYMFALEETGLSHYGEAPHAAGLMYVPVMRAFSEARNAPPEVIKREGVLLRNFNIIDAMERGEEKKYLPVSFKRDGSLTASSLVLTEKEFAAIKERVKSILARIGDELSLGIIDPNPYVDGNTNSCRWCDYKSVCAFDEERSDDCMRELCEVDYKDILKKEEK